MPKLSELQVAALAAVRDNEITSKEERVGYQRFWIYRAHRFDVSCQIRSLRKRRLIRWARIAEKIDYHRHNMVLTAAGREELAKHPEF